MFEKIQNLKKFNASIDFGQIKRDYSQKKRKKYLFLYSQ